MMMIHLEIAEVRSSQFVSSVGLQRYDIPNVGKYDGASGDEVAVMYIVLYTDMRKTYQTIF